MTQEEIETAALVNQLNFGKPEVIIMMFPFEKQKGRISKRKMIKRLKLWYKQALDITMKLK